MTRADLEVVMQRRRTEMTHNLLIFALQRTIAFESSLSKVATGATLIEERKQKKGKAAATASTSSNKGKNPFGEEDEDEEEEEEEEQTAVEGEAAKQG